MNVTIDPSWRNVLQSEFEKGYFRNLVEFVKNEYKNYRIFPEGRNIFRAFDVTKFDDVKVVILGQDPYHTPKVANGLAFSANVGMRVPPSLQNIYKELNSDLGVPITDNPDLTRWAEQGVLLLNATLTVRAGEAGSHQNHGWEIFTDAVVQALNSLKSDLVFILWGSYAQVKGENIDEDKHLVLKSPHPSPFSANRGFFGSKPFSKTNDYLRRKGKKEIVW